MLFQLLLDLAVGEHRGEAATLYPGSGGAATLPELLLFFLALQSDP